MKKYGRLIVLAVVTSLGPALYWIGGGNERNYILASATGCCFVLGVCLAMMPGSYPWEE